MPRLIYKQNTLLRLDTFISKASVIRPANTDAYGDGDAISDDSMSDIVLKDVVQPGQADGGAFRLESFSVTSDNGIIAPTLEIWFFDASPSSQLDGSPFSIFDFEKDTVIGTIKLYQATEGFNNWRLTYNEPVIMHLSNSATEIFMLVKVIGAYQPVNNEEFKLRLVGVRL